jgi:hypothetical protein
MSGRLTTVRMAGSVTNSTTPDQRKAVWLSIMAWLAVDHGSADRRRCSAGFGPIFLVSMISGTSASLFVPLRKDSQLKREIRADRALTGPEPADTRRYDREPNGGRARRRLRRRVRARRPHGRREVPDQPFGGSRAALGGRPTRLRLVLPADLSAYPSPTMKVPRPRTTRRRPAATSVAMAVRTVTRPTW